MSNSTKLLSKSNLNLVQNLNFVQNGCTFVLGCLLDSKLCQVFLDSMFYQSSRKFHRIHPKVLSITPVILVQFYLLDPSNRQLRTGEKNAVHDIIKMDAKSLKFGVNCPLL